MMEERHKEGGLPAIVPAFTVPGVDAILLLVFASSPSASSSSRSADDEPGASFRLAATDWFFALTAVFFLPPPFSAD